MTAFEERRDSPRKMFCLLSALCLLFVFLALLGLVYRTLPAPERWQIAFAMLVALAFVYLSLSLLFVHAERRQQALIDDLQHMNARKNEFLSIAAHQLKTPLTVVSGFSQLLQARKLPKEVKEELAIVDTESRRLADLVIKLLDISSLDLHAMSFSYEETDVRAFLAGHADDARALLADRRQALQLELPDGLGVAWLDRQRVWQVLRHLLENAAKYSPERSTVTLSASRAGELVLEVKDQGAGVPKEEQERIFERFYKAGSQSRVGLSLAVCKGVVEQMGGRIWASGSSFFVSLPLRTGTIGTTR